MFGNIFFKNILYLKYKLFFVQKTLLTSYTISMLRRVETTP
ncbi:hypothetical protein Nos7524_4232 [Nostoc sp. PCC 7524]|nr:hypothetical protein Nos7524_4232 [Nostoc sp. PCC 7524]